jgi:putative hydrolase of the HAD superfamily
MTDVLFDVDGVLIHGYHANSAFSRHWDEHLEVDFGISRADFRDRFIRAIFESEVLTGRLPLLDALRQVLPTLGHSGDPQKLIDYWMERDAALTPELLPYVERLHTSPNVRLFLATNQESVRANYLMNTMGLAKYFHDIFNSARLGVLKPDPRFFERVERLLDRPEKPTFFDDREEVVEAARLAGWDAHQFDRPEDLRKSQIVASLLDRLHG